MASQDLVASVGKLAADDFGKGNLPADVKLIKRLLNAHAVLIKLATPLDVNNPYCGETTIKAIENFQRTVMGINPPSGRIKPTSKGGSTLKALQKVPAAAGGLPPRPAFHTLSDQQTVAMFGGFTYDWTPKPDGVEYGYETIRVKDNWADLNLTPVTVEMGPVLGTKTVRFHRRAAKQFTGLWAAWKAAGLLPLVLTGGGTYAARYMRSKSAKAMNQRPKRLSMHAYGVAFDINIFWNGFNAPPAQPGTKGSVQELVPLAHQWGFYWGGHFSSNPDGMHFEIAKLL